MADSLRTLRDELDGIDDRIHALLMERAAVVTRVAGLRAKGPVALRPGREAAILARLLRQNRSPLDPETLVRIWRDILNGSTGQQQLLRIAVASPGLIPLVRQHFGTGARIDITADEAAAIEAVRAGAAEIAALRWPGSWWRELPAAAPVRIVAQLPVWRAAAEETAMVLTAAGPDPSGRDRTLMVSAAGELEEHPGFLQAGPDGSAVLGAYALPLQMDYRSAP